MSNSNRIKIARSLSRENLPSVLEYGEPAYVKNVKFVLGNGDGSEFVVNDWSSLLNKPTSFSATAAEDIPAFRFVAQDSSGELILANRTSLAEATVVGISTEEILTDETGTVLRSGSITNPAWSLTPGLQYYLDTDGTIRSTVPDLSTDAVAAIGTAQTSTTLFVSLNAPRLHDLGAPDGYTSINPRFDTDAAGWVRYNDGAVAAPVDGTGGTPSYLTFARTTSSPLVSAGSGLITKSAASALGEGVSYDFTIDRGLLHEVAKVEFQYEASANYADGYVGVFLYDKTNASLIPISVQDIPASYGKPGTFLATFIPSTSTEYRLIFHVTTATTTAWTMMIDNVVIGKKDIAVGAAISEWQSYTPTIAGAGTLTDVACFWRRVGDTLEVSGRATSGTVDGSTATITLPSGLTQKDYTINRIVGQWWRNLNTAGPPKRGAIQGSSGTNIVYLSQDAEGSAATPFGSSSFNALIGSSQVFSFMFSVRIAQWTSNVNLASDFTEYAYNSDTTSADNTTSFAYGSEGALIPNIPAGNKQRKRIKFKTPIKITDAILLEVRNPASKGWDSFSNTFGDCVWQGLLSSGVEVQAIEGSSDSLDIYFGQLGYVCSNTVYAATTGMTSSWSSLYTAGWRWRVRKVSNGNMAEVPPVVRAEYVLGTPSSFPYGDVTTINYNTKAEDTHNAVTTGTAWKFTAPIDGIYSISLGIIGPSISWPVGCKLELAIKHNEDSSNKTRFVCRQEGAAYTGFCFAQGTTSIRLKAGESVSPQLYTITTMTPFNDIRYNNISITRIGS